MRIEDSSGQPRSALLARLQGRFPEIEECVLTRIKAVGETDEVDDPEYLYGLRAAIPAAISHGLSVVDPDEDHQPPVPTCLLTQARVAARHSVSLDTVLRRYVVGRDELSEFIFKDIERTGTRDIGLTDLLGALNAAFDRLLGEVGREYRAEQERRPSSSQARQAERIKRLLAGERIDTSDLGYNFDAHHLGLVTEGDSAPDAVRALAKALDGRALLAHPTSATIWAWIGLRHPVDRGQIDKAVDKAWPAAVPLALSELGAGISGWRLAHKQARAVFPFAVRHTPRVVRYVDAAVVTSLATDEVVTASLREVYLTPLEGSRDGGAIDRETLCAYFAAGRNGRAAAAALQVSRQTVSSRLQSVEEKIGLSLLVCGSDLELALRLANHGLI